MCGLVIALLLIQMIGVAVPVVQNARAATVEFRIGYLEAVDSLNPFRGLNDPSYQLYGYLYDYLYALDQDGNLVPNLATDAACDAACMNWTYTIRQGVSWSDGTPFTADDVNFTINYNIQNFFQLWAFEPYVNRIIQCSAKTRPYCGAVQTGAWQVTVYFDLPFVPGKGLFIPIIQKAQWSKISASQAQYQFDNPTPIGTGPFIAAADIYQRFLNKQPLLVHKNPNYHPVGNHTGSVHIDDLYVQQYSDENSLVLALQTGAIQLAKLTSAGYGALQGAPNIARQEGLLSTQYWNEIGITQITGPSIKLNPARQDESVRRAFAMATNKDYIIQTIYQGKGVRGDSLVSPITPQWWYDPRQDSGVNLTYSLAAANALLDAAGYTDRVSDPAVPGGIRAAAADRTFNSTNGQDVTVPAGTELVFTMAVRNEFPQEVQTANYVKSEWAKIGVKLTVKAELESALSDDVYGGAVETYIWYWSGDPDPNYLLSIESGFTLDGWNDNYWDNATYNQLYVDHLSARDFTTRQQIVRAAEKLHYQSAVYIIYVYPYGEWAYRTDRFTGWGDWNLHPYRQLDAFWGANPLFFDLAPIGATTNNCPTVPAIQGTPPLTTFTNATQAFSGTATDPDAGQTLTWTWNWGNLATTIHSHPSSVSQDNASYAWANAGYYNVTLAVSDGQCTKVSGNFQVIVQPRPAALGWINGTVTDAATTLAINGATVTTSPGGYGQTTDASGHYSIEAPVNTYTVTASAALHASQSKSGIAVTKGNTTVVDFALATNVGWIAGTVTSSSGGVISGAAIYIYGPGGAEYAASTDAQGKYNKSLSPGTYAVNASAAGYIAKNQTNRAVQTGMTTTVDFQLDPVAQPAPGLSPLVIAGVGLLIVVVAIALVAYYLTMRKRGKEKEEKLELPKK